MAETVDDICLDWTDEDGVLQVRQVSKEVLTKGAWSTLVFAYQDRDRKTDEFGPVKFRVGRYQKRNGRYLPQSKFNISSVKQARQISEILSRWAEEYE
ncbi:MAG TPA: hypothetical protein VJ934_05605 [Desulfomicrobiaceae bacterium]|jgi:hypothetical protein|nr:hypothetical protein [Desulfomicrobiaceae bacterium]